MLEKDGTPKMESGYGRFSKKCVAEFRANNPKIVGLWKHLDKAFKNSVLDGEFSIGLPSGRALTYRKVAQEWTKVYDEEKDQWRNRLQCRAEGIKLGRLVRIAYYGGMLTENMIQAIARDVFGEHCLALDREFGDGAVLFSAHDEAINEVDQSVTAKDVEHVMSQCPEWLKGCPIAAEAKEVPHYLK